MNKWVCRAITPQIPCWSHRTTHAVYFIDDTTGIIFSFVFNYKIPGTFQCETG